MTQIILIIRRRNSFYDLKGNPFISCGLQMIFIVLEINERKYISCIFSDSKVKVSMYHRKRYDKYLHFCWYTIVRYISSHSIDIKDVNEFVTDMAVISNPLKNINTYVETYMYTYVSSLHYILEIKKITSKCETQIVHLFQV